MAIKNTSELQDARTNKYAPSVGGGIGFEIYQIIMGAAAFVVILVAFWSLNFLIGFDLRAVGIGVAVAGGIAVALWPNYINTHHKDSKQYIRDEVSALTHHSLVINDQRVKEPADQHDAFVIAVAEFPPTSESLNHD